MDKVLKDKIPPHNLEAEQATLGALLLDWGAISDVAVYLKPDNFYSVQNKTIYRAMISMALQNIHGDTLTLINELTKTGELEQAGGTAYIAALTDTVPTSANIDYYAGIVMDAAIRRELILIAGELKASSFDETKNSKHILEEAEKKIFNITERNQTTEINGMKQVVNDTIALIEKRIENKSGYTGIPSGFLHLDSMTSGFQNQELIIIGARPSMGKTAMALSMIQYIAVDKKIPCGFFTLEMSYAQIGQRLLSQVSRVPGGKIRSGMLTLQDLQKIQDAAGLCYQAPLYIVDTPNMQLLDLRAMARRMVINQQVKIIFVDYIGLITTENSAAPVYEQVSEISKSLKALARELNIPIVVLCQLARDAEGNEPNLAQLRGSGSIEQDADVVMFIHRERKKADEAEQQQVLNVKLIIAKQRNGPIGDVELLFLPSVTRFENIAK
ncbi:replicative DNA helicase [Treponema parvum]|uniref:Replicative DNA helicase n=1 Tax=Treponema parvum TaxID=138851 RepID=A0A975F413_9SPIR|nr:replicative DNA helicase [Treponema parvum]QTQ14051.1 replicative DNA helicase [Treponema parvum]